MKYHVIVEVCVAVDAPTRSKAEMAAAEWLRYSEVVMYASATDHTLTLSDDEAREYFPDTEYLEAE
jgi:hypothetical protein